MAFAYSNQPIYTSLISAGASKFALITLLYDFLTTAMWPSTVVTGGYEFVITSPQGLTGILKIWDDANPDFPNCIALQMISTSDNTNKGFVHYLQIAYPPSFPGDGLGFSQYLVWANACSLFIAEPGEAMNGFFPRSFSCGIPFAYGAVTPAAPCVGTVPTPYVTNEMWWSAGDSTSAAIGGYDITACSFRTDYLCNYSSFMYNGGIANQSYPPQTQALQLLILRPSQNVFLGYGWYIPAGAGYGLVEADETPKIYDPILAGYIGGSGATIVGEMYDVCLLSMATALEETIQLNGTSSTGIWVNYTYNVPSTFEGRPFGGDDGRLYSLLLLQATPVSFGQITHYTY